jgi:hypothetical protein
MIFLGRSGQAPDSRIGASSRQVVSAIASHERSMARLIEADERSIYRESDVEQRGARAANQTGIGRLRPDRDDERILRGIFTEKTQLAKLDLLARHRKARILLLVARDRLASA